MDRFNGGTPTLCISVRTLAENIELSTSTHDVTGAQELTLFDPCSIACDTGVVVELTLIDWASTLELHSILVEKKNLVQLPPSASGAAHVLVIGDSLSCGWAEEEGIFPLGYLSAFPFVLQNQLRETGISISVDLVAYPGWTLVDHESSLGMESKFFHEDVYFEEPFHNQPDSFYKPSSSETGPVVPRYHHHRTISRLQRCEDHSLL